MSCVTESIVLEEDNLHFCYLEYGVWFNILITLQILEIHG